MADAAANGPGAQQGAPSDDRAPGEATVGGAPPQQPRSIERQAQVRSAAVGVLLGSGAGAVTHRRVAEEASASLGAIRYYFRTRADLLAACLEEIERVRTAEAERVLAEADRGDPSDAERTAWMALRVFYGPDLQDDAVTGMAWCIVDCARESPDLAARLARHRQAAGRQVQQLLAARGHPDVRPTLAPAILDGSVTTAAVTGTSGVAETAVAELAAVLQGTVTSPGR